VDFSVNGENTRITATDWKFRSNYVLSLSSCSYFCFIPNGHKKRIYEDSKCISAVSSMCHLHLGYLPFDFLAVRSRFMLAGAGSELAVKLMSDPGLMFSVF
jgi:hypothetical protein